MLHFSRRRWPALLVAGIVLITVLRLGQPALAGETPSTLQDLVQMALKSDHAYQSAELRMEQAQTNVKLKAAGNWPQAGVTVKAGVPAGDTMAGGILSVSIQQSVTVSGLGIFGVNAANEVEMALWDLGNATLACEQQKLATTISVYQHLIGVVRSQEVLASAQRALTAAEDGLKRTRRGLELGTATRLDELSYRTSVQSAQTKLVQAQQDLQTAAHTLEQQIGSPLPGTLPLDFVTDPGAISEEVPNGLLPKALEQRADVSASAIALQKAQRSLAVTRNEYRPQVTVNSNAATSGLSATASLNLTTGEISWSAGVAPGQWIFPSSSTSAPSTTGDDLSLNVKVFWNLWDAGAGRLQIARAQQDIDLAKIALDDAKQAVKDELENAVGTAKTAYRQWLAARERLDLLQEKLRLRQTRDQLGVETADALIGAEEDVADAQTALVEAKYDWVMAVLALDKAAGVEPFTSRF